VIGSGSGERLLQFNSIGKSMFYIFMFLAVFWLMSDHVLAAPSGPTITLVDNETWTEPSGYEINTTGGTISTLVINATNQNLRWKAYVGNVTGEYVLEDASGDRVFDWTVGTVSGEVYATRHSGVVTWAGITCAQTSHTK